LFQELLNLKKYFNFKTQLIIEDLYSAKLDFCVIDKKEEKIKL